MSEKRYVRVPVKFSHAEEVECELSCGCDGWAYDRKTGRGQTEEEAFGQAKIAGETQVGVGRDSTLAQNDLVDAPGRNTDRFGQLGLAEFQRPQELLQQDLARMRGDAVGGNHGAPSGSR